MEAIASRVEASKQASHVTCHTCVSPDAARQRRESRNLQMPKQKGSVWEWNWTQLRWWTPFVVLKHSVHSTKPTSALVGGASASVQCTTLTAQKEAVFG